MNPKIDELLEKVKIIAQTPYGEMLGKIIDSVYERVGEEYDSEPPECPQALEVEAACKRGDYRWRMRAKEELPSIASLGGSDPHFSGDLTTEEYIRSLREK